MHDRIKEIRQALHVSQQAFADMLGVKRSTVSQWELGINKLSEPMARSICSEFGVNEEWFRTGCGEMFIRTDVTLVDRLCQELNANHLEAAILRAYFQIDPHVREPFIRSLFENAKVEISAAIEQKDALWTLVSASQPAETAEEKAARLERENKELRAALDASLKEEQKEPLIHSHILT